MVFEDATLEKVVREYLGKPKGAIYSSDLEAVDALRILDNSCSFRDDEGDPQSIDIKFEGEPVKSAADLKYFPNLKRFVCFGEIQDLTPFKELTNLTVIEIYKSSVDAPKITDITPLAGLTVLADLYVRETNLDADDVAALQKQLPDCDIRSDFD